MRLFTACIFYLGFIIIFIIFINAVGLMTFCFRCCV